MTDFLDRLEADLRVAAEQRGRRRRRNPVPALKLLAAAAVTALLVVGAIRISDDDAGERSARPTPTPTRTPDAIAFFSGSVRDKPDLRYTVLAVPNDRQRDLKLVKPPTGRARAADPSLGTAVLYQPGSEATARWVGRILGIETRRPLTDADRDKLSFDTSEVRAVVVFGEDALDHFFADPHVCQQAGRLDGRPLRLCNPPAINGTSVFYLGRTQFAVKPVSPVGHWAWAAASPDGTTILGQWSAECEVPLAALIPVATGTPRLVSADESEAKGWTTDGRAIVVKDQGPCGGSHPGTYLVTPQGVATRISTEVVTIEPSIAPRDVSAIGP